jgi:hypothetical protein
MLDDDAVGLRRVVGGRVGRIGSPGDPVDERLERVDLGERVDLLEDHRRALEAHPGVDVLLRKRRQRPVLGEVELHEDEVPELEVALAVAAGAARRPAAAVLLAAVVVELRARPAGARFGRLPEILRARQAEDPLARQVPLPRLRRHLVLAQAQLRVAGEDRRPQPLGIQVHPARHELPRVLDGTVLEVVAEREVAEHLVEAEVPVREADVVEVVLLPAGAHHLLHRRHAGRRRLLGAEEPALHRLHAGDDEQRRRVVGGRDDRRGRSAHVALLLEEGEEAFAKLGARAHAFDCMDAFVLPRTRWLGRGKFRK